MAAAAAAVSVNDNGTVRTRNRRSARQLFAYIHKLGERAVQRYAYTDITIVLAIIYSPIGLG